MCTKDIFFKVNFVSFVRFQAQKYEFHPEESQKSISFQFKKKPERKMCVNSHQWTKHEIKKFEYFKQVQDDQKYKVNL